MWRKKVSLQSVTHKAHNTVHHEEAMRDWVRYVLGQMQMLDIPYKNIANLDETYCHLSSCYDGPEKLLELYDETFLHHTKQGETIDSLCKAASASEYDKAMFGCIILL
jgi:hypothetical protein